MSDDLTGSGKPPLGAIYGTNKQMTWALLRREVMEAARSHGLDPQLAANELAGSGVLAVLIRSQAGVSRPSIKRGPRPRVEWDRFVVQTVNALQRGYSLKGEELWQRAHFEIASNASLMGEFRNIQPGGVKRAFYRAGGTLKVTNKRE